MLTKDFPDDAQFVIMKTDYYNGEPCPRMCQPGWEWGGAQQSTVYPATVPGMRADMQNQVTRKRWPRHLVEFYRHLNLHNLEYAFRVTNGNINNSDPKQQIPPPYDLAGVEEMPKFEVLTYVGNTHVVKRTEDKGVLLDTLTWESDTAGLDYKSSVYVSKFCGIREDGLLFNLFSPPDDNYMPIVSYDEFWIPWERAELYPLLGYVKVTSDSGLNIRDTPSIDGKKTGILQHGWETVVSKYYPSMGNVWGYIGQGWIALRYQPTPGQQYYYEPTNWTLETKPPPRPYANIETIEPDPPSARNAVIDECIESAIDALERLKE